MPESELKCLCVEDEKLQRILISTFFPEFGWKFATSLKQGAEIIHQEHNGFHLVYLDLNLPDSSGIRTIEEFRQLTTAGIVVATGGDTEEIERRAEELGVLGVIPKGRGYTEEEIRKILVRAIERAHMMKLLQTLEEANDRVVRCTERRTRWLAERGYTG